MPLPTREHLTSQLDHRAMDRLHSLALNLAEQPASARDALLNLALLQSVNQVRLLQARVDELTSLLEQQTQRSDEQQSQRKIQTERQAMEIGRAGLVRRWKALGLTGDESALTAFEDRASRQLSPPDLLEQLTSTASLVDLLAGARAERVMSFGATEAGLFFNHPEGLRWVYGHPDQSTDWWRQPYWQDDRGLAIKHLDLVCRRNAEARQALLQLLHVDVIDLFFGQSFLCSITAQEVHDDPTAAAAGN